jgi:GNAT superfamily N-acetyltransferase
LNYEEERSALPLLPHIDTLPDLNEFVDNHMGVAAFDGGEMLGFLCSVSPFPNPFQLQHVTGAYSPLHAHGAAREDRATIYATMYRAAGEKWAKAGCTSHAVSLYLHDTAARAQFEQYGFGLQGFFAIRAMEEIPAKDMPEDISAQPYPDRHSINDIPTQPDPDRHLVQSISLPPLSHPNIRFYELPPNEHAAILPLANALVEHFHHSPMFIFFPQETEASLLAESRARNLRYFVAEAKGNIIAYYKVSADGENFICETDGMVNICGAYCLPDYRGQGIAQNLLNHLIDTLRSEGLTRLGVDFESFNPTARGFWLKYFSPYNAGFFRRIDERSCL